MAFLRLVGSATEVESFAVRGGGGSGDAEAACGFEYGDVPASRNAPRFIEEVRLFAKSVCGKVYFNLSLFRVF